MSYSLSPSPPPPMPSPLLVPTPLPSPPPFTKITSRRRLTLHGHPSPPIPPSLVGSPLLNKTLTHAQSHDALHRVTSTPRFPHDASKAENRHRPSHRVKRTLSSRCRSPPPSPAAHSPPPPVPPIPAFILTTNHSFIRPPRPSSTPNRTSPFDLYLDHPREDPPNMCCESQTGGPLTCVQFFAVHKPTGQCRS